MLTALAPLSWGTTYLVTSEILSFDRPLLVAALRALPIGLLLLLLLRRLPSGVWWGRVALLGTLNIGLFFALLFFGAYRLPGGLAATVGAVGPFAVLLLAWALLGQRPRPLALAAAALGMGGVALMVLGPSARLDGLGIAAMLTATVGMAIGTVLAKRWGRPEGVSPLLFTAWQLLAGGLLLAPLSLLLEGAPPELSALQLSGLVYLGLIGTGLAYTLWFRGIARLQPGEISMLSLLSPLSALILDWAVLGRTLEAQQLLGAALVLGSIFLEGLRWPQRGLFAGRTRPGLERG
nr:EamA family transporter [Deinobacterium chartae]